MKSFNNKIGLVVANNRFGGQEKRYFKIAYKLFKEGYNVHLYAHENLKHQNNLEINELIKEQDFLDSITFIKAPRILKKIYKELLNKNLFLHRLNQQLSEDKTDIIITNKDLDSLTLLQSSNIKIIKDFTSPDDVDIFFETEDYIHICNIDHLFFISRSVYNRFIKKMKSCKQKFVLPSYSVFDLPFYEPPSGSKSNCLNKEKAVVFAHRFIERKNPILFAEVIKKLTTYSQLDGWKFYILGRGPLFNELSDTLSNEVQQGRVILEYTPKLNSYLEKSSIFVSLIEPDNFPSQSILEAMYFGNALVILNSGESETFVDKNGILVEKSSEEITEKMKSLMESDLNQYFENSKNIVETKFNSSNYIEFYISELKKHLT